jgi:hypothetical protein
MRLRVVLNAGAWPHIRVAEGALSPGHLVPRHYYRTGLPSLPRARVVTHTAPYECSCGRQWSGTKPCTLDLFRHDEVPTP